MPDRKKASILGYDVNLLAAVGANVLSWFVRTFVPSLLPRLAPPLPEEDASGTTTCVVIARPGGTEQLRKITLRRGLYTAGYNVADHSFCIDSIPPDCVLLENQAFSVNYADCCIRWGLYESANQFVGYPICPGFDVAGVVQKVGSNVTTLAVGDAVYGCSLFGAYSTHVVVPENQLRHQPSTLSVAQAAALPAVTLTALYALHLAGQYPTNHYSNRAILIHSAAGGVGSCLVQMAKLLGMHPIVGVVGRTHKVEAARALGCDVVLDRNDDVWKNIRAAAPDGYACVMDSSGAATLQESYNVLAQTGRLISFGFHTNLPLGRDLLSPWQWMQMASKMNKMPRFDAMDLGTSNKSVMGFNLSFLAAEKEMMTVLFDQVHAWITSGELECPRVVEMDEVGDAHALIQSGQTIGKIVVVW